MTLILEKGYDSVTVEDITQRADLGRTTFYLHYHDKEELLLKCLESVAEELKEQIGVASEPMPGFRLPGKAILTVFKHAHEHAALYLIILNGGAAIQAMNRLHNVITHTAEIFFEQRSKALGRPLDVPVDVLAAYFSASLLSFVTWWLRRGSPETPEDIAQVYTQLVFRGLVKVLGEPGEQGFTRTSLL